MGLPVHKYTHAYRYTQVDSCTLWTRLAYQCTSWTAEMSSIQPPKHTTVGLHCVRFADCAVCGSQIQSPHTIQPAVDAHGQLLWCRLFLLLPVWGLSGFGAAALAVDGPISVADGWPQGCNIALLVLLPTVTEILFEYWRRYQRYFFAYFWAIFHTNTFVVRCTS